MPRVLKVMLLGAGVIVVLIAAVYLIADRRLEASIARPWDVPLPIDSATDGDPAAGERIVHVRNGCVDCHGPDLAGKTVIDDPAAGHIAAPNLTPFALSAWSDGEIARAIRHGIGRNGRALRFMPALEFSNLSEGDLKAVVAYLRTLPPVAKPNGEIRIGPMMKMLYLAGEVPILLSAESLNHAQGFATKPAEAPTAEFGKYLVNSAFIGCHGQNLKGGPIPGAPPDWAAASDISSSGIGSWNYEQFAATLKTGVNPTGKTLAPPFPLPLVSKLTDVEMQAMWQYLSKL